MDEKRPVLDVLFSAVEYCCDELTTFNDGGRPDNLARIPILQEVLGELCRILEESDFSDAGGGVTVTRRLQTIHNRFAPFMGAGRLLIAIDRIA